jgi:uncharacterized protein (TIGR02246 family)
MTTDRDRSPQPLSDEQQILALIERWSKAVRDENRAAIGADHDPDILMFDVPLPLQSQGLNAYMTTWDIFFPRAEKPVKFNFTDVRVTCGKDVAFATAIGHCVDVDPVGNREALTFRLTMGLRKKDGRWCITHEHHSLPAA